MSASSAPYSSEPHHLVARLRFRHLNLLTEVQARGSLRAAAQSLNLTQPALSKALAEIEAAFGFPLFLRTPRGLKPTAQGAVVLRGATLLLAELGHVHAEALAADRLAAKIRIGAPPFVAQTYLPEVIQRLVRHDAPLRVQLQEDRVPALIQSLQRGELDALITTFPLQMLESERGALQSIKLFEVQFAAIAARGHPLLRARRADWIRLAREPWVMPVEGSMGRRLIEDCFRHSGVPVPPPVIEATSPTTSLQLVAAGLGLGIVPDVALLSHGPVPAGAVGQIRVAPEPPSSAVALIFRSGPMNPRIERLQQALGLPGLQDRGPPGAGMAPA